MNSTDTIHYTIYNRILDIYLCTFVFLIPLIFTNGYTNIVETKYIVFIALSVTMFLAIIFAAITDKSDSLDHILETFKLKSYDISILVWYLFICLSTFLANNRRVSISGEAGWYIGWTMYTIILITYICVRLFAHISKPLLISFCISNIITSTIGILDTLDFRLLPMMQNNTNYLTTIGNIDWICGYFSVVLPILTGIVVSNKYNSNGPSTQKTAYYTLQTIRFLSIASLILTSTFALLQKAFSIYIVFSVVITYFILIYRQKAEKRYTVLLTFFIIFISAFYFVKIGLFSSILSFNMSWGNGRGASIAIGIECLRFFSIKEWAIGIGPDGLLKYISTNPTINTLMNSYFTAPLVNTHCEPLTTLINTGILGTIAYYVIWTTAIICIRKESTSSNILSFKSHIITMIILSYLFHNLVSFQQIMNVPFIFITLGLYEPNQSNI